MPQNKRRVLIVDDEAEVRLLIRTGLDWVGVYEVMEAKSGEQALEIAGQYPLDLVLMDIMMPGIDGLEVCRQIKAAPGTQIAPVVFLSAQVADVDQIMARETGGVELIAKPFSIRHLLQIVARYTQTLLPDWKGLPAGNFAGGSGASGLSDGPVGLPRQPGWRQRSGGIEI